MKAITEFLSTKVNKDYLDGFPASKDFDEVIEYLKSHNCVDLTGRKSESGFISEMFEKMEIDSKRFLVISNFNDGGKRLWFCGVGKQSTNNPLFHCTVKENKICNFRVSYTGMFNSNNSVTFEEFKREADKYISNI